MECGGRVRHERRHRFGWAAATHGPCTHHTVEDRLRCSDGSVRTSWMFWHKGTVSSQSGVALRFPPHSILWLARAGPMHGVRWQSEVRTPTPLWLGEGNSWPLHSPHGGGQMALWRTDGSVRTSWMFWHKGTFPAKAVSRCACHRTPYWRAPLTKSGQECPRSFGKHCGIALPAPPLRLYDRNVVAPQKRGGLAPAS